VRPLRQTIKADANRFLCQLNLPSTIVLHFWHPIIENNLRGLTFWNDGGLGLVEMQIQKQVAPVNILISH
jgi:hypothetical protein